MKEQTRECLNCKKELLGRSDKKYCDNICKSEHYNKTSVRNLSIVKKVNNEILNFINTY